MLRKLRKKLLKKISLKILKKFENFFLISMEFKKMPVF